MFANIAIVLKRRGHNKWVAQLWRSVCGVTRLLIPARRAASLHAIQTVLSEIG
jgi:hypothetical protein